MILRGVIERFEQRAYRAFILTSISLLLSFIGCRDTQSPEASLLTRTLQFRPGDRFIYDGWVTDRYGVPLNSFKSQHIWDVLSTSSQRSGFNDVVVIRDSISSLSTGSTLIDTVFLRAGTNGEIFRYGFLAELLARREGLQVPKSWDRIAWFGTLGWTVGSLDSAGQLPLTAQFGQQKDYFEVKLNGISTVFPADRVEMSGETLDYFLWLSDAPACFPRWEEAADPFDNIINGSLLVLREATIAPRLGYFLRSNQSRTW